MTRLLAAFVSVLLSAASTNAESGQQQLWRVCDGYEPRKSFVGSGTTEDAKRIIGAYQGKWANQLDHVLIIDRVAADGTIRAFYAWGHYSKWGIEKGACKQDVGTFRNSIVTLRLSREKEVRYVLSADGLLAGEYHLRSSVTLGLFHRFYPLQNDASTTTKTPEKIMFPSGYVSEKITTGRFVNGQPVRLQIIVSKPPGEGPFPLVVFHHGSVGQNQNEAAARGIRVFHPVSQYFVKKGWMVVAPQRLGRGWSDGVHDEGLVNDRSRYSCDPRVAIDGLNTAIEDAEAVMENVLERPDVDTERVIVGGNSRGGGLALAYAGRHPDKVRGVINISGGWHGTVCASFKSIHERLATDAARSSKPTLWLHGGKDDRIELQQARTVFDMFVREGGSGFFVPQTEAGHDLLWENRNWTKPVSEFMAGLGYPEFAK